MVMMPGSAWVGGPCAGLLKTKVSNLPGKSRSQESYHISRKGRVWSLWKTCPCSWDRNLPSGGAWRFGDLYCNTHLPASEADNRILGGVFFFWSKLIFCRRVRERLHGSNLLAAASKGTSSPRSITFMAGVLQNNVFFFSFSV